MLSLARRILQRCADIVVLRKRDGCLTHQRRHYTGVLLLAGLLPMATARDVAAQQPSALDTVTVEASVVEAPPDLLSRHARSPLVAAVAATIVLVPLDRYIQSELQNSSLQHSSGVRQAADWIAYAGAQGPFYAGAGSFVVGRVVGSDRLADLGLHLTEAAALASGISALGKGIAGRELPDVGSARPGNFSFGRGFHRKSGDFVSFPAGHATVAFASAAVITSEAERWRPELGWPVGVATYGFATLVAVTRMYQNRHWASDNPIAALIGTSTGLAVVRRQHSGPRTRFDRWLLGISAMPTTEGGVAVVWSPDRAARRVSTE
jgi:membrane-associated phospholipid phosphatase